MEIIGARSAREEGEHKHRQARRVNKPTNKSLKVGEFDARGRRETGWVEEGRGGGGRGAGG
jgi:hypothetical protein